MPAVITLAAYIPDETTDGIPIPEACRKLEEAGADVVGLNCARGPATMMPLIKQIRKICKVTFGHYLKSYMDCLYIVFLILTTEII